MVRENLHEFAELLAEIVLGGLRDGVLIEPAQVPPARIPGFQELLADPVQVMSFEEPLGIVILGGKQFVLAAEPNAAEFQDPGDGGCPGSVHAENSNSLGFHIVERINIHVFAVLS